MHSSRMCTAHMPIVLGGGIVVTFDPGQEGVVAFDPDQVGGVVPLTLARGEVL